MVANSCLQNSAPRTLLPTGITTNPRPRIEWKWSDGVEAWQVRVRDALQPAEEATVVWLSPLLRAGTRHVIPDADFPSHCSLCCEVRGRRGTYWSGWGAASLFRVEPVLPLQRGIVVFDLEYTRKLSPLQAFAHAHLVSALQGLVNRHEPRLYVRFIETDAAFGSSCNLDDFWLERMKKEEGWLSESITRHVTALPDLLELFGDVYSGLVVWDPAVPPTSNVASTIAGADGLLPVPFCCDPASLYTQLIIDLQIPVGIDLRGKFSGSGIIPGTEAASTGSSKCDAYLWAKYHYLETGKCDPCYMGNYLDAWWVHNPGPGGNVQNHTITNHDYFIARRGFFWDLNVWPDEAPIDDPGQAHGTDLRTLQEILAAANKRMSNGDLIHVGGFTPWAFKYTNHPGAGGTHEPVPTEWELVRVLSSYNAYLDADALGLGAMANASFVAHYPLPHTFAPVLANTPAELLEAGLVDEAGRPAERDFILNYVGDYDSAAWAWGTLSQIWESAARGKTVATWAINPNLADRAAPLFDHLYRTRTANDHFMAGDSGAGYVNPTQLLPPRDPSQLPDATQRWTRHCVGWYRRFGIRFTGFLINGSAGHISAAAERMYLAISPDGIVNQHRQPDSYYHMVEGRMPAFDMLSDIDSIESGVGIIRDKAKECGRRPRFLCYRHILKMPQYYADLLAALKDDPELEPVFCDSHTFSCLARAQLGISNDDQYSLLFNYLPASCRAGEFLQGAVAVRNDGWNIWLPGEHALQMEISSFGSGDRIWQKQLELKRPTEPGESVIWQVDLPTPDFAGEYLLELDMSRNGRLFSSNAGYAHEARLKVKRADVAATL